MRRAIWILIVAVIGLGAYAAASAPPGPRSIREFNPDQLADLELRMWQAYYAKENVRLFRLLIVTLREQYHYPWTTATVEGFHLARAAATFGSIRSGYEAVLPDLETGYSTARDWLGAGFDPAAVARAELAWWIARRIPGEDSPEHVGGLIADEYAMLYETQRGDVLESARLRAEAAALRDQQAAAPDWDRIGQMLNDSYVSLHAALHK